MARKAIPFDFLTLRLNTNASIEYRRVNKHPENSQPTPRIIGAKI